MQTFLQSNPCCIEDVGHDVGGSDEIDVMAADLLEADHHIRHIFILNLFSPSLMRDWPVLAEDTAEIAVGKEDRPRPIISHQRHLFTKMGMEAENHRSEWSPAEAFFTFFPIHPTPPGTELTMLKDCVSLLDPLG
jgi:hypothetical protein